MLWLVPRDVIDGTGGPPRRNVAVGIDGHRIAAIVPRADMRAGPGEEVVQLPDEALLPGFVDSHVHLTFSHASDHARTRQAAERASDAELALLALRNAQACLRAGVTTVRDCGGRGLIVCAVRDAIDAGLITGPRILAAGPPITTPSGHLHWCGLAAEGVVAVREAVARLCQLGVDLIKVIATGGNMTAGSDPFQVQYSSSELQAVVLEAHQRERRVAAHAINGSAISALVEAGVDTIEHCWWQGPADSNLYDAAVVAAMARRDIWVGVTMTGLDRIYLRSADGDPVGERQSELAAQPDAAPLHQLRLRHVDTRRMLDAGVKLMLSSDAGVRNTAFEDFALSITCGVIALDIEPVQAIALATRAAADALGLSHEVGSIEVGKQADFVLVRGDPASRIGDLRNVQEVWLAGRPAYTTRTGGAQHDRPISTTRALPYRRPHHSERY